MTETLARVVVTNGAFTKGRDATRRILKASAAQADVLLGCEFKYVDVGHLLGDAWTVAQDTSTEARAGSVVAVRDDAGRILAARLVLGVDRGKAAMLDRWFVVCDVELGPVDLGERFTLVGGHFPPLRYVWLWPAMAKSLRQITAEARYPVIVGCDWNRAGRIVSAATGLRWRGRRLLGLASSPGVRWARVRGLAVGSDHKAVWARLLAGSGGRQVGRRG